MQTPAHQPRVICLMGPTAAGKTQLAVEMVQRLPAEIVSVDSAMIYRGMDIGTAKPDHALLQIAPHRLLDIIDPGEHYSAGRFCKDALREIEGIVAQGKIPLLVGGSMMYFRALQQGIAAMPTRDPALRAALAARAATEGWAALHHTLMLIDPAAAARIHVSDGQRIQRALEVFMLTGKTITAIQQQQTKPLSGYEVINIGLMPARELLHARIATRFEQMLAAGLVHEVNRLYCRGDLHKDMPSMRAVGYRELWEYLAGDMDYDAMVLNAVAATRQLAKRQLTWLRSWPGLLPFSGEEADLVDQVCVIATSGSGNFYSQNG